MPHHGAFRRLVFVLLFLRLLDQINQLAHAEIALTVISVHTPAGPQLVSSRDVITDRMGKRVQKLEARISAIRFDPDETHNVMEEVKVDLGTAT
jgi:hypothetical protein